MAPTLLTDAASTLVEESRQIREKVPTGMAGESPAELHSQMLEVRAAMDRVGAILAEMILLRAKGRAVKKRAEAVFEDAWDAEATKGQGFKQAEPAARERYAQYTLHSMDQKVALREAERVLDVLEAGLEVVRVFYWGVEAARRDLDMRVRLLVVDRRLEG